MNNNLATMKNFSLILIYFLFATTEQLKIPMKLVKTRFRKNINKKSSNSIDKNKISKQIKDTADYIFAIDITLGSNKQPFTLLVDTGSEIVWVPGQKLDSFDKYFNPKSSSTSKKTSDAFHYEYADGYVAGYYYYDQINFMTDKSFYFTFGVADKSDIISLDFDGIVGLGRKYNINKNKYSILNTLKTNGAIASTKFSFKYDYNTKSLTFYLDEIHEDFKNKNLASCPLIDSEIYGTNLWACELFKVGIKSGNNIIKEISIEYEGLFDTGTNNIIFPSEFLNDFESTFTSFNCYLFDEGENSERMLAVYCRDKNNLPKITISLKSYKLTLGKENFYNQYYINKENIYRLRLLFVDNMKQVIIGQNFFYEYHTLFDDSNDILKFYNDDTEAVVKHEESRSIKLWVLLTIILGSVIFVGSVVFLIIYFFCCRKKNYNVLAKELLEMSSIKKSDDNEENIAETSFNKIMNIAISKKSPFKKIHKRNKNKN